MIITIRDENFVVEYVEDLTPFTEQIKTTRFDFVTFDTETTGLHIREDRPFLAGICADHIVYIFPATKENMRQVAWWAFRSKTIYGHNIGYDMHMLANAVEDDRFPVDRIKNWGDTMCFARLIVEAKSTRHGGDRIGLKHIGKKYIDKDAGRYEDAVKDWLEAKRRADKRILTALCKPFKHPEKGSWTADKIEKALKHDQDIPQEVMDLYAQWRQEYPKPTYADVPTEIMIPYLAVDVILTRFLVLLSRPVLKSRAQIEVVQREFRILPVIYKMERRGIRVDREYLEQAKVRMADYIDKMYAELHELTGLKFSVGQHQVIKEMYTDMLGEEPESTDKKFLKKLEKQGGVTGRTALLISRIRRFEKWLATYVVRILKISEYDGRYYTQLNPYSPVSGRFSGDSQQFPKDPIYTEEGYTFEKEHPNEPVPEQYVLYHPRKPFIGYIYYLDYSQIELRIQGHYTTYFGGDLNLCRAYMPFRCMHYKTGEIYDYTTVEGRTRWGELKDDAPTDLHWEKALKKGHSVWLIPETAEPWIPTDVHMATTLKALVSMGYDPDTMDPTLVQWWRKKGKTFNFMRNYGGGNKKAAETLEIELKQATALNQGYTDAFPLVVTYQNEVIRQVRKQGYVTNMYGRRYYLSDWNKSYTCANYLIQGSSADMLKIKMYEIDQFLQKNSLEDKLGMVLCIHDELQFEQYTEENLNWAIQKIKIIMETASEIVVPIVAEVEQTRSDWASKEDWIYEEDTVDARENCISR